VRLASVGDIGTDSYVDQGIEKPGGIAFNFAIGAAKNNWECSLISAVGTDNAGRKLRGLLPKTVLDSSHLRQIEGETANQKIKLNPDGEKQFVGYKIGVLAKWKLTDNDLDVIVGHDAVFVPLSDGLENIFNSVAKLKGACTKVVDFSQDYNHADFNSANNLVTRYAPDFDIIFVGGNQALVPCVKKLSALYPAKVFVITLGAAGSYAFYQNTKYFQKAKPAKRIVDTTGCGDAFQSAFTTSFLNDRNVSKALMHGAEQALEVISYLGSTELAL
jgi:fructoselysine 6-kinase